MGAVLALLEKYLTGGPRHGCRADLNSCDFVVNF